VSTFAPSSASGVTIVGADLAAPLDGALLDAVQEDSIEQAATLTLTLEDPDRALLAAIGNQRSQASCDGRIYELVHGACTDDQVTLTFEDAYVAQLRRIKGALTGVRGRYTRAEFARRLVPAEFGFNAPELTIRQPVDTPKKAAAKAATKPRSATKQTALQVQGSPGTWATRNLKIDGVTATANQLAIGAVVIEVGRSLGASEKATLAALTTGAEESGLRNLTYGDQDSVGVFQQQQRYYQNPTDVQWAAATFYAEAIKEDRANPKASIADIASAGQRMGGSGGMPQPRFDSYIPQAYALLQAYRPSGDPVAALALEAPVKATGSAAAPAKVYVFSRGADEDSWTALRRLADEVAWRVFMVERTVWFASDAALIGQPTALSLSRDDPAVLSLDYEFDVAKASSDATLQLLLASKLVQGVTVYQATLTPGMVVKLTDPGPAQGVWLVKDVQRSRFSDRAQVELTRPTPALPEPVPDTSVARKAKQQQVATGAGAGLSTIEVGQYVYNWAAKRCGQGPPAYQWDAHHGETLKQMQSEADLMQPFDCSSLASHAWAQVGVYVGDSTTDQISRAQATPGVQSGSMSYPVGGFIAGDLVFPESGHVEVHSGQADGRTAAAKGRDYGIQFETIAQGQPVYFWARWHALAPGNHA
jgi:hypothetical protein